jgi:hypothetical protein
MAARTVLDSSTKLHYNRSNFIEIRNVEPCAGIAYAQEDDPMRHHLSLDFWLWLGVGLNVLMFLAAAVRSVPLPG